MGNGSFDAVVLAGGKPSKMAPGLPNKNFIRIKNRPLFMHVVSALLLTPRVNRVYVTGPKQRIEEALAEFPSSEFPRERVIPYEQRGNIVENVLSVFWDSVGGMPGRPEDVTDEIKNKALIVIAGDCPLITAFEVEQFLDRCDTANYDYMMGMTPARVLDYYRKKPGKPGISLAYSHFTEDLLRINNIHLVKPLRVKNREEFLEMYNVRHLLEIYNTLRLFAALLARQFSLTDWIRLFKLIFAMYFRKAGMVRIAEYMRKNVPIRGVEETATVLLGTRSKIVVTDFGGAALDVDKKRNIRTIEERYDEWMAYQENLASEMRRESAVSGINTPAKKD